MADPFVAEIRIFPFNFAPKGWAFCNGQILPISQNTALFSLLGTTYGGDGKSNFALPDLQGRATVAPGQGPGLSLVDLGQTSGAETVSLLLSEMPLHNHNLMALNGASQTASSANASPAKGVWVNGSQFGTVQLYTTANDRPVTMSPQALSVAGGDQPHSNMQPYLTMNFCIALQGVFPPRG